MRTATLVLPPAGTYDDEGTFCRFIADNGWTCAMLALPYRDANKDGLSDNDRSRLPEGAFLFRWGRSPKWGLCYLMLHDDEAPNRGHILIHPANLAGDVEKGFVSQLEGCFAPGADVVTFRKGDKVGDHVLEKDQHGVSSSGPTLKELLRQFRSPDGRQEDFLLTITANDTP